MKASNWPNCLSAARLVLMPAALMAAICGSRIWFVALLVTALVTDALDGYLARRLKAESDFGRKLDSAADYLLLLTGVAGIALLWPDLMRRELPWVIAGLASFFAVVVYGFVRMGRAPCYHTWAAKVLAVGLALALVPLLAEWTPLPFRVVMALQVLGSMEELAIATLVPWHTGEVPTVWHAWKLRRARPPAGS
jgi:phosphatidylglycerophosphate synthase